MRKLTVLASVVAAIIVVMAPVAADGRPLTAELNGANEVGAGDTDGSGTAHVTLNQGQGEVCFSIETSNVDNILAAHIHVGAAGVNGGVVVNLDWATTGGNGCVTVDADTIKQIRQNPAGYYINVHSPEYPAGAIRGQLAKSARRNAAGFSYWTTKVLMRTCDANALPVGAGHAGRFVAPPLEGLRPSGPAPDWTMLSVERNAVPAGGSPSTVHAAYHGVRAVPRETKSVADEGTGADGELDTVARPGLGHEVCDELIR